MKFFIFILLIISLLIVPVFIFAECNKTGITVIFVNGIFGDKEYAEKDKKGLEYVYGSKGLDDNTKFVLGYNSSHGEGASDLIEAGTQMYLGGYLDHDLTDILRQVHTDLKTQKVLLVGHSQGTFYTNATYDYLIGHGVDKRSIAVYNVATPADNVAGGGNYLTSSSDKIIDSIARKLAILATAKKPLPANIDIKIPNNPEIDYRSGHSFSQAYLGLVPDKIIGGIDQELNALTANSDKKECFVQPELGTMYRVFNLGYQIVDNLGEYNQHVTTLPFVQKQITIIEDAIFQGIYNFGKDFVSNVAWALGQSTASVSSFFNKNNNLSLPVNPIFVPDLVVAPIQPENNLVEASPVVAEQLSYQDQLDNIQEKLDIIKQQVQEFIDQQNLDNQPKEDKREEDQNKNDNKEKNKDKNTEKPASTYIDYPKILISEVQISPIGQRFIELYNPNSEVISLTGWYLQRKDNNDSLWGSLVSSTNFEGKTIPANGYLLISREIGGSNVFSNITLSVDNSLALKNPNGDISDKLGFGSAIDPEIIATITLVIGQSIGRKVSIEGAEQDTDNNLVDFEVDTPTPKAQNIKYVAPPVATLVSIAITTPATKLTYNVGEELDITGLVATGTYSDSTTRVETVTLANITGFDSAIATASQTLTITIGEKTATYLVSINNIIDTVLPSITTYIISNQVFSPNGDGNKDTTSIDLEFSEDVIIDLDIINSVGVKVRDIYNPTYKVKNPDAKVWDGKDNLEELVPDGVYTIKVAFTDMAGNSITDISKKIAVDNLISSSANFTISPECLFSSSDVSDALGDALSVVTMCGCSSPAQSDEIKNYGIEMKACGWNSSTNETCHNVTFYRNGDSKKWTYQTIYIINGFCSLNPTLPDPIPSSDTLVNSSTYMVSIPKKGSATIINLPFGVSKAYFLANLSKNQAGQTWNNSAILDPVVNGNILVVTAEDGMTKAIYTISAPNSGNFTISPECLFSSSDVSDALGDALSVVTMCGCSSPAQSDEIRDHGIGMKKNCGWNSSTNETCHNVSFYRNGDSKEWTYQTIYIIGGVCSLTPSLTPIDMPEIKGIRPPVIGASPVNTATESSEYTSTVSWLPNDGPFIGNTSYTAKITITPKTAYSLIGIPENFFTVAGTSFPATSTANSGVIMATFLATAVEETTIPSTNYTITPDCVFSSPDVSNAFGNSWSVVNMCGCSSPNWSDTIRTSGHNMKACGWNSSTNQTCSEITFGRNGSKNMWAYPAVYITNGVCNITPPGDVTPPSIITYTISSETISPNGDGVADTTDIDWKFSEEVKAEVDILDAGGVVIFKDFYKSDKVTNPHVKIWDGKDSSATPAVVPDGVYTIKIVITDMAGNSIIDTSKTITVDAATSP